MRVLVTGAAGFIGSHVSEALLREGHEVVGVDCFTDLYDRSIKERNLSGALATPDFEFHELDLRSADLAAVVDGIDAVVNEAALPGLPQSWTRFDDYLTCNVVATQRLLEAVRPLGIRRFLHVSTSSVYGAIADSSEEAAVNPTSPYGVTKLAGEQLVRAYGTAFDLPYTVLRYFSIYGPRQRPDMAYNIFIRSMLEGRKIVIFGDGSRTRTSTYIEDCVRATLLALENGRQGETYNIGGSEPITVSGVVDVLAELTGVEPIVEYGPDRIGDQVHTRAVTEKAREHFGYEARTAPRDGLEQQLRWQEALAAEQRGQA